LHRSQINEAPVCAAAGRSKVIICVGTIGFRKGQTVLAEAFSRIAAEFPDWKLALIGRHGEAELVAKINQIIASSRLADRILLLDNCPADEVNHWMQTAAIFAMPSFFEGLGLSLQEALFQGCACIASRAGGITDLIQNGANGILVERGDVTQLADNLRKLMADASLRERLSLAGRQSIIERKMFAEDMVENYVRLYEKIQPRE
jgi:glycosyltransferase involved in cell wall biosynthesis